MKKLNHADITPRLSWALNNGGAFLNAKCDGGANTMTIGWATIGDAWGKPVFMAMVRLSRHTHPMVESTDVFTVSIPRQGELADALKLCGTRSGRDTDKFAQAHITAAPAQAVDCPIVAECDLHLECRVVYATDMNGNRMAEGIARSYKDGDFHTLYFGEIVACYAT